jgi:hypothetical protein
MNLNPANNPLSAGKRRFSRQKMKEKRRQAPPTGFTHHHPSLLDHLVSITVAN